MFNHHLIKRSLASGIVIAAAGFPTSAQAMFIDGGGSGPAPVASNARYELPSNFHTDASSGGYFNPQVSGPSVHQAGSGFQWDDAGIGAAGAALLLGVGALGTGVTRRRTAQRSVVG